MDGILSIFQGIASSEGDSLNTYLNAIDEHQSFRLKGYSGSDSVVQHITSVLSKPATRSEGLVLLNSYLEQCSVEALEQKGMLWMTLALKACNSKESENVGNMVYIVLKSLATKSVEIPDVSKAFVSSALSKIYDSLSTAIPCAYQSALECVETCLRLYPGPSGPSRGAIEKFLYKFTDASDEYLVYWSGKCLHLLQQVRGGGVQGISHKAAWQSYQIKLLGSLHSLMDSAFANCTELYDEPIEKEQLNIAPIQLSDEPVKRAMQLYTRVRNLINYLVSALRQPYPVPKPIAPKKILNLIIRGLSVTCHMLQKNQISDNLAVGALLPKIQIHLFELLEAFILTLKSHLAVYHTSILGIILDTLKWTSSKRSTGYQKPYSALRSSAYNALTLWCSTMNHGSRCEIISDSIVEEIIFDITPFENAFTLKVLSGAKKHMSKKARKQLHKAQNEQSNLAQTHSNPSDSQAKKQLLSDEGNQKLCLTALRCLRSVFLSAGCFLKPTVVKSTHLKVIQICLSLSEVSLKNDHLYGNYSCRLEAYNVLYSLILAPHHLCPPPTQMAVKLLQTAQIRDVNLKVRETCSMILNNLEKIIHPQKEGLLFPPDIREIKNAFHKVGKERLLLNDQDAEEKDDEDDDSSEEDGDIEMEVPVKGTEKQAPTFDSSTINISDSVDLTLEENVVRDDSIELELESSNDSVEFVSEKNIKSVERPNAEPLEIPKSPEITLRVEDEEGEDEEGEVEEVEVLKGNAVEKPNEDEASSPKKPRLEKDISSNTSDGDANQKNGDGTDTKTDKNEVSFEEIAAAFVDELN